MKVFMTSTLAGVSLIALLSPVTASADAPSPAPAQATASQDVPAVIVSARRKDELLQDVPKSISAVTSADINNLNIRRFEDVSSIVPGLSLDAGNGYAQLTTLRGISFDVNSGQDAATDFYLNDSSIQQGYLFRSLYDISQIEVEKGPQGTLRGRSTPSGSINFATTAPNLYKVGGYVDGTVEESKIADNNVNGAINVPIIQGMLAVRLAASFQSGDANGVTLAHAPGQDAALTATPYDRTWSQRVSVRFEPTDSLQFNLMYQHMVQRFQSYPQTASDCTLPNATTACTAGYYPIITPQQRLSTVNGLTQFDEQFDVIQGSGKWSFHGQSLNYIGSYSVGNLVNAAPDDGAAVVPGGSAFLYTTTHSRNVYQSHEIRLSSEERIAKIFDYTVGLFTLDTPTDNTVFYPGGSTVILANGDRKETSVYGNLTAHPTGKLELTAGIRHILKSSNQSLTEANGNVLANNYLSYKPTIWTASASYHFTRDLLGYVSAGTSFRQGTDSVGPVATPGSYNIFAVDPGGVAGELNYVNLKGEYSHSYEIGIKSEFAEKHGIFNIDYFHQTFSNFLYSSDQNINVNGYGPVNVATAANPATYVYDPFGPAPSSGFGANVPVKIDGVEADLGYHFTPDFNLGASLSYVKSKIAGGTIPCNAPNGSPLLDAFGAPSINVCPAAGRPATYASPFGATVRGEYDHSIDGSVSGYFRGLLSIKGASLYNPDNPQNEQKAYALLNLYAGLKSTKWGWDVSLFVKNVTNTQVTLAAYGGNNAESSIIGYTSPVYSTVALAPPRQVGVNLRYTFGSR
jgi:iron complex outermembrane receptor protein